MKASKGRTWRARAGCSTAFWPRSALWNAITERAGKPSRSSASTRLSSLRRAAGQEANDGIPVRHAKMALGMRLQEIGLGHSGIAGGIIDSFQGVSAVVDH